MRPHLLDVAVSVVQVAVVKLTGDGDEPGRLVVQRIQAARAQERPSFFPHVGLVDCGSGRLLGSGAMMPAADLDGKRRAYKPVSWDGSLKSDLNSPSPLVFVLPRDPQSPSYDANIVRGSYKIAKLPVLAVTLPVQFIPSTIPVASIEMLLERWGRARALHNHTGHLPLRYSHRCRCACFSPKDGRNLRV